MCVEGNMYLILDVPLTCIQNKRKMCIEIEIVFAFFIISPPFWLSFDIQIMQTE